MEDGGVEDAGITLGHFDAGVTEHLRYVFQAYALREAEGGVSVTGGVESDRLRKEKQTEED